MNKIGNFFKGRVFDPTAICVSLFAIVVLALVIGAACGFMWICENHPEIIAIGLFSALVIGGLGWLVVNSFPKKEAYDKSVDDAMDWLRGLNKLKDENEESKNQVAQLKEILRGVHSLAEGMLENKSCAEPLNEELHKIMEMTENT